MNDFSKEEKIEAFDKIAAKFFDKNFGTMSKSDFETLLFSIYIEHRLDNGLAFDDYTLARALGISQTRIRTLKVNKELKYPRKGFDWRAAFVALIKNAKYDESKQLVKLNVPDVNVLVELRHFIEQNGWYDEYQLNPRLFQCRLEMFVSICQKLQGGDIQFDDETKAKMKELAKEDEKIMSYIKMILSGSLEDGLKGLAKEGTKAIITSVLSQIPFGGFAATAVGNLIEVINKS